MSLRAKLLQSLKMRLSWGVSALVLVATFTIATIALHHMREQLQKSISEDQFQRLSALSDAFDIRFRNRRTLLKTLSEATAALPADTSQGDLQSHIEKFQSLKDLFDSVSFIDPQGNVVANLNMPLPPGSLNVADREYFQRTLAQSKGVISRPYRSKVTQLAQVTMTEPVFNADGSLRYVTYGAISLGADNFLGGLQGVKFGETGYMFILNTEGIIIDLPDKSRILEHVDARGGANASTAQAIAGFEGSMNGTTRAGVPGLFAFKRTHETDWILAAFYPESEAYAAIDAVESKAWLGALVLSLLAGVAATVVVRRELTPLTDLHERMLRADAAAPPAEDSAYGPDEIGELSRAFDDLMRRQSAAERQIRTIIDNIPALVSHVDTGYRYTFVNARVRDMYPDCGELVGRTVGAVRGETFFRTVQPYLDRALAGESVAVEKTGGLGDGHNARTYQSHFVPDVGIDGKVKGVFALSFDTTALTSALHEQETAKHFLHTITDNLPVLISYFDRDRRIMFANATVMDWLGLSPEEVRGMPLHDVIGGGRYNEREAMVESALAGHRVEFDAELHLRDRHRLTHTVYIPDLGKDGEVRGVFSLTLDVTETKAVEKRLAQLARQDGLTGLPNRTALDECLPVALARSQRTGVAMAAMFLDIDHFKQINDQLGHSAGDAILVEFAERLRRAVRVTDTVFRLGGDEFVVLVENIATQEAAEQVAQKIGALIRGAPFEAAAQARVTASIGVCSGYPGVETSAKAFLEKADEALYAAKAAGRDRYHCEPHP